MLSSQSTQIPAGRSRVRAFLVTVGLAASFVHATSCSSTPARPKQAPLAIRAVNVRHGEITQSLEYVGTVHSRREVKVLARVQGTVSALPYREGQRVKKGSTIARLSAHDLAASYRRTVAEVGKASAEQNHQCYWYRQYKKLEASGTVARVVVDRHRRACQAATASHRAARASRALRGVMASKTRERSPFNGRVLQWLAEPGQNVMPGQPILLLGNEEREIRVFVVESDLLRHIRQGTPVLAKVGKKSLRLKVGETAPMARGVGRTVEIRVPLPASASTSLRNGMSVNVSFVVAHADRAVSVPTHAVVLRGAESSIYLVQGERVRRVPVRTGVRNGRWVQVHGELPPKSIVATSNLDQLSDRSRVFVVRAKVRSDEH